MTDDRCLNTLGGDEILSPRKEGSSWSSTFPCHQYLCNILFRAIATADAQASRCRFNRVFQPLLRTSSVIPSAVFTESWRNVSPPLSNGKILMQRSCWGHTLHYSMFKVRGILKIEQCNQTGNAEGAIYPQNLANAIIKLHARA